jgi:hypothetical protein
VGPACHSVGLRGGAESTFFEEQYIRPTLLTTSERFLYVDHVRYV